MANENRYYAIPFGESGNRAEVPDVSVGGAVAYDSGFGPDYELPQSSPSRKRIERDLYNGMHYGITKNLKQWQEELYPTWIEDDGAGSAFAYSQGMIVSHAGQNWISNEDANQEEPGVGVKWSLFNAVSSLSAINDRGLTFPSVVKAKTGETLNGTVYDLTLLPEFTRLEWQGYHVQSDGGSNWGRLRFGVHTDDGFSVFSIDPNTYIEANIVGTVNPMMAGLLGGATSAAQMQTMLDGANGKVKFGFEVTYDIGSTIFINNTTDINLNGSTLDFTLTTQIPGVYDKSNGSRVHHGLILVNGSVMGGNGHSLACITVGEQSTGNGQNGFKYHNLELTTNRNDAGAHVSIIGGCYNGAVRRIKIRDNAVCRNLIGVEWGGTPGGGTQHPHDISISQINVGKITTPTFGTAGFAYVVWCSSAFNVSARSINCEESFGIMACVAGDNANEFAPTEYADLIGTGLTLKDAAINACFGTAIFCGGKGGSSANTVPVKLKAKGITAKGKKVGGNNNFGLRNEYCDGVHLSDFLLSGFSAGTTEGVDCKNTLIENGTIEKSELYGSQAGNATTKSLKPTFRNITYRENNSLGGASSAVSAVVLNECDDAVVEHCNFGVDGGTETQRYSVFASAGANRPKIMHNHTYVNDNPGIDPYLIGSATAYLENNTKDF